jgi:hypothetical protein
MSLFGSRESPVRPPKRSGRKPLLQSQLKISGGRSPYTWGCQKPRVTEFAHSVSPDLQECGIEIEYCMRPNSYESGYNKPSHSALQQFHESPQLRQQFRFLDDSSWHDCGRRCSRCH